MADLDYLVDKVTPQAGDVVVLSCPGSGRAPEQLEKLRAALAEHVPEGVHVAVTEDCCRTGLIRFPGGFEYDAVREEFTLFGVRYSLGLFETLGLGPVGSLLRIVKREGETLTLERLPEQVEGA